MVSHNSLKQKKNGFTLIELLVAVAVLAVVSSFVFASVGRRQQDAARAAQKLVLDIRAAQNKSLAPTDSPVCVYGVKMRSTTTYDVYYDPGCTGGKQYNMGTSVIVSSIVLQDGVTISNFSGQDIAFEAPEPITYLNGATGASPMTISLHGDAGNKDVIINRFGRVDLQ